jgi:folate-dependent tRNA-U54 methylase TrmFO/GidA
MNVNFGLFPPIPKSARIRGKDRKQAMSRRALEDLCAWLSSKQAAE